MINITEDLVEPVFQHLVPVLVYETSRVLGFVPIKSTMFLREGTYVLWSGGPLINLCCVTQPRQVVLHGNKKIQFLAIVYREREINKRFNLKGFISVESKQRQYQAQWISIKPGAFKLYDVNIFKPFFTGIWDTSSDYERAHTKNEDFIDNSIDSSKKESVSLNWCLKLPLSKFSSEYDYVDTDWIHLFHTSLQKRGLDDTPIAARLDGQDQLDGLKVSLMGAVLEASEITDCNRTTLPSIMQIMRLHDLQPSVKKFTLVVNSKEKVYNITISIVLKASGE